MLKKGQQAESEQRDQLSFIAEVFKDGLIDFEDCGMNSGWEGWIEALS